MINGKNDKMYNNCNSSVYKFFIFFQIINVTLNEKSKQNMLLKYIYSFATFEGHKYLITKI